MRQWYVRECLLVLDHSLTLPKLKFVVAVVVFHDIVGKR